MANLKTFSGFPIQNLTSDPVPYAQALADNPYAGVWASGANMNVTDKTQGRGSAGSTHSTSLAFGGAPGATGATESYNGTAWTELNDLNNARGYVVGMGTNTAALAVGGNPPATAGYTEVWNGSSWTETADLTRGPSSPQAAAYMMGSGSSTSGLVYGGDEGATNKSALTESWNGSAWTEVNDLNTSRSYGAGTGTSNTAALCLSGFNWTPGISGSPLVEQWNGSSWTEIADVNGRGRPGASCQGSVTATIMFGGSPDNSTVLGNTESWDGSAWTEVNDLSTARNGLGGSGVSTNALAFGGLTPPVTAVTEEWTFSGLNPATTPAADYSDAIIGQMYYNSTTGQFKNIVGGTGTWASGTNTPGMRSLYAGIGTVTASLMVTGYTESGFSSGNTSYNGSAWTELGDVNLARATMSGFGTYNAAVITGGYDGAVPAPTAYKTNVEEWDGSSWTEVTNQPEMQTESGSAGSQTAGLIFGGGNNPGLTAKTKSYDGTNWTEVNALNTAKNRSMGYCIGTQTAAMIAGGDTPGPAITGATESWNGTSWTELNDMNTARFLSAGSGSQTSSVVAGGRQGANRYTNTELWDGTSWTEANDLATSRSYNVGAGSGDGSSANSSNQLYAAGVTGPSSTANTTATEEWNIPDFEIKSVTTS